MLKKLFKKRQSIQKSNPDRVDVILRLMFEIAISDGSLDKTELSILKQRAAKISTDGEKTSDIIKKVIDETEVSSSLYPTVKEINKDFSIDQKKEMLQNLWELVAADGVINHHEENLFFKIADLIKIKRSQANQIKQRNS
ncbi:TerB family tellurite resistance protein [bacterium]|nr:TerB family tellurite resistance protein [bacterium]MDA9023511.1 TerB family tellurite resistance protein [Gammaproteobacteria bacterium]MDA9174468.1 TerB family tellurite resistance protein [Gammaproteobacteria bacterium]MDA9834634.1 TerB family tellurite resistance protein [Gammaproteobacteria bacterium]MDA9979673.1 TerB family tellurite resistance protein [Gammaproteobacteria bacterium]